MTPVEARALRDEIKAAGLWCTIPRGESLPRIGTTYGEIRFASRAEWLEYDALRRKRTQIIEMLYRDRTPMEIAIDNSCGITQDGILEIEAVMKARWSSAVATSPPPV